jgi:aspartate racemase
MSGRPIIGILGGMGPLAGADFLARLTLAHGTAQRDQDHPQAVLFSATQVPDRTAAALDGGASPLPALVDGLRLLEVAGAGVVAIPCNSAHVWFDAMQAATRLPMLHIVEAAADALPAGTRRVGVMGTRATLRLALYQQHLAARGIACITPTEAEMAEAVVPAITAVKANKLSVARAPLLEVAQALAARGAQAVVLGCTEIPLALRGAEASVPLVDTIDALARAALGWWLDQTLPQPPATRMSSPVT